MKKLVLGVAMSLAGFSAINAAPLKCDSKEAKIAFAVYQFDLTPKDVKELRANNQVSDIKTYFFEAKGNGKDEAKDSVRVYLDDDKLSITRDNGEYGIMFKYSDFESKHGDNNIMSCSVQEWEINLPMESEGQSIELSFRLLKDSNGNLIVREVRNQVSFHD